MKQNETAIDALRQRLTETLADWGAEMSTLLHELEHKRAALAELRSTNDARGEEHAALQSELAELRGERDEAREDLRRQHEAEAAKDAELERLRSELESKQELIRALRRETHNRIEALEGELRAAREAQQQETQGESAELVAVRAELEARKTLIKSLRADADRVDALETSLEEKREIIATLEASINRHADTIAELKRAADLWKRKYQDLKGSATTTTTAALTAYEASDPATLEERLDGTDVQAPSDRTIAIDMRQSLLEARRRASARRKDD